jgi:CRP-like cAMP-binding protein
MYYGIKEGRWPGMKILLADDSKAMRTVYRDVLQKLGHASGDILDAPDGRTAMTMLQGSSTGFSLAVFDWDLPGMVGAAATAQLRDLGLAGKITVLFCINRQQRALVPQAARLAPCDYIERPFSEEVFEAKIRALGGALEPKKGGASSRNLAPVVVKPDAAVGLPFLVQLPSIVMSDLLKLATAGRYDPGTTVLRAGEISRSLHLLTLGKVEILEGAVGRVVKVIEEGDPFGELSFMTSQPSSETVRARTIVQTASLSKMQVSELLRKHPIVADHLSGLMARHKKAMSDRAITLSHSDFKGTVDTMPFADILQMLISTRKTGVLGFRCDEGKGALYLADGEAIHAWTEDLQGEEAFYALASWTRAKFAFTSIERKEPRTLTQPTITLLMKAMRRMEEAKASGTSPNDPNMDALFPP